MRLADVAIGLTASGSAPYVAAALQRARRSGAFAALLTSNPRTPLRAVADVCVCADTGGPDESRAALARAGGVVRAALGVLCERSPVS